MNLRLATLLGLALISLNACRPADPAEDAVIAGTQNLQSQKLGIAVVGVPETWTVQNPDDLRLVAQGEKSGEIWFEFDQNLFNLVDAVNDWKSRFESMEGGSFLGQLELGTQLGPAYTVRGRYQYEGAEVEERRIIALHPDGSGLIHMAYRYPLDADPKTVGEEMFALFAGIEGLMTEAAATEGG